MNIEERILAFRRIIDTCSLIPKVISTTNFRLTWNPDQGHWSAVVGNGRNLVATYVAPHRLSTTFRDTVTLEGCQPRTFMLHVTHHVIPRYLFAADDLEFIRFGLGKTCVSLKNFQHTQVETVACTEVTSLNGPWWNLYDQIVTEAESEIARIAEINPTNDDGIDKKMIKAMFELRKISYN